MFLSFSKIVNLNQHVIVTAEQMRSIEARVFAAGMPVAALMEKVGGLIVRRIMELYPLHNFPNVGVLAGPGHNGGDALVVARELHFRGYDVAVWCPIPKLKELTMAHACYVKSLSIPVVEGVKRGEADENLQILADRTFWVDGLFGFGLERPLIDELAQGVNWVNQQQCPIVSIDLPSGLHADTGKIFGTAIQATDTLCLGLWKRGLLQDQALSVIGQAELLDFDLPGADISAVLGKTPALQRLTAYVAIDGVPLPIPPNSHKYTRGHLLLVAGSRRYRGAAILAGMGARASGVGLLSIAVPLSLQEQVSSQLPEALIIPCPETSSGAIARFPNHLDLARFDAMVFGPGLTLDVQPVLEAILSLDRPLLLDADGLNGLAQHGSTRMPETLLQTRPSFTVLTPHPGEFKRLFPALVNQGLTADEQARQAAGSSGTVVVLKGARTAIAEPQGVVWINPESTPALARGGSGDVLAGLMGGLMAIASAQNRSYQHHLSREPESTAEWGRSQVERSPSTLPEIINSVKSAVWWHAQAGCQLAQIRTDLGVDAWSLSQNLGKPLSDIKF